MHIVIGSDHAGVDLKQLIIGKLQENGHTVTNCGTNSTESVDYPDIAEKVALEVLNHHIKGIIICGTGIGISISANKVPGIRAALCHDVSTACLSRQHNDANILAVGARVTDSELALEIVQAFLSTEFEGGRHQRRVDKITAIEGKYSK